jgi:hypothetical protein
VSDQKQEGDGGSIPPRGCSGIADQVSPFHRRPGRLDSVLAFIACLIRLVIARPIVVIGIAQRTAVAGTHPVHVITLGAPVALGIVEKGIALRTAFPCTCVIYIVTRRTPGTTSAPALCLRMAQSVIIIRVTFRTAVSRARIIHSIPLLARMARSVKVIRETLRTAIAGTCIIHVVTRGTPVTTSPVSALVTLAVSTQFISGIAAYTLTVAAGRISRAIGISGTTCRMTQAVIP